MRYGYGVDISRHDYTDEMAPLDAWRALWTVDEKDLILDVLLNWMHHMPTERRMWHSDSADEDILLFNPERIAPVESLEEDWRRCDISLEFLVRFLESDWNLSMCPNSKVQAIRKAVIEAREDVRRIIRKSEEAGKFPSSDEAWDAEKERGGCE